MNWLIDAAVRNNRVSIALMVALMVAGIMAFTGMPREQDPDITIPVVAVTLVRSGISPEDAQRLLIRPVETELRSIQGVKKVTARANEGLASVVIEFTSDVDPHRAVQDVRDRVDMAKSKLPDNTKEPVITEFSTASFPVVTMSLSGDVPETTLNRLAIDLQDKLRMIPGVLEADIQGGREDLLEMEIDPAKLAAHNITQEEIFNTVNRNNKLIGAGSLDSPTGRFAIKLPSLFTGPADVLGLPIKASADGVVTLGDVANVRRTFKDPESISKINGRPARILEIRKRGGKNIVEMTEAVKQVVAETSATYPPTVSVQYIAVSSEYAERFLHNLQNAVITAIVLVVIVVVAALGLRSAMLVGFTIPASFLFGLLIIASLGYTLNQIVMFGMILAVGLLVDAGIVIVERADRKIDAGVPPRSAYVLAAKDMAMPVISSMSTTMAAFAPLLFWPGTFGKFIAYLPATVIAVLAASLVIALLFIPVIGLFTSDKPRPGANPHGHDNEIEEIAQIEQKGGLTAWYLRTLPHLVRRPFIMLGIVAMGLVGIFLLHHIANPGVRFFPQTDPNQVALQVRARGNLSISEREKLVDLVASRLRGLEGFDAIYTVASVRGTFGRQQPADTIGSVQLVLKDWRQRPKTDIIIKDVRQRVDNIPGIVVEPVLSQGGPARGKDVQLEVSAATPARLSQAAEHVRGLLQSIDGVIDIEDTRPLPGVEWQLQVDRGEAAKYGVDMQSIGNIVQLVTDGIYVGDYRPDDAIREVEIRVRYPNSDRNFGELDNLKVQTASGAVPISRFVKRVAAPAVGAIERSDYHQVISIRANVAKGYLANNIMAELKEKLAADPLQAGSKLWFRGSIEDQTQSNSFLTGAVMAGLLLMTLILLLQFNSFYQTLVIMSAVLLSTAGVLLGMTLLQRPFVVMTGGIAVVALAGIVVNHNVLLIDGFVKLKNAGLMPLDAIVKSGAQRLRPVLLTTITAIIGHGPMVFMLDIDLKNREIVMGAPSSFMWVDLSLSLITGLTFATVLTLVVTPTMLAARYAFPAKIAGLVAFFKSRAVPSFLANSTSSASGTDADVGNTARALPLKPAPKHAAK